MSAKTPTDAFLAYQWKFIEDQTQIFHQELDRYISNLKEKIFKSRNDQLMLMTVEFLMQPFPDLENQSPLAGSDVGSKVSDLVDELHLFKKTLTDNFDLFKQHSQEKMAEQKLISTKHRQLMERREKKMRKQLRMKDKQIIKLENSHKLVLKICGEFLACAKTSKEIVQPIYKGQGSTQKPVLPFIEDSKMDKVDQKYPFSEENPPPPKTRCLDTAFENPSCESLKSQSAPNMRDTVSPETLSMEVKENKKEPKSNVESSNYVTSNKTDMNRSKYSEESRRLTYDRAYLLKLGESPFSFVKPKGLPILEIILDEPWNRHAILYSYEDPQAIFLPTGQRSAPAVQSPLGKKYLRSPLPSGQNFTPDHVTAAAPFTDQKSLYRSRELHVVSGSSSEKLMFDPFDPVSMASSSVSRLASTKSSVAPSCDIPQTAAAASSKRTITGSPSGARLLSQFLVDQSDTAIKDIVALAGGLVLVSDEDNKELKLFHMQGECLQLLDIKGTCRIAKVEKSTVAVLYENYEVEILHIMNANISSQNSFDLDQNKAYTSIVSVDKGLLGIAFQKLPYSKDRQGAPHCKAPFGVDIYNRDGNYQATIDVGHYVSHMCKAEDGTILCSNDRWGDISKIDVYNGKVIFCHKVPQVPRLSGMSYLPKSRKILVCGGKHGNLSVLDEQGQFLKEVYHSKSGGIYIVSVHDDMCVWEGHGMLYIMKFDI